MRFLLWPARKLGGLLLDMAFGPKDPLMDGYQPIPLPRLPGEAREPWDDADEPDDVEASPFARPRVSGGYPLDRDEQRAVREATK